MMSEGPIGRKNGREFYQSYLVAHSNVDPNKPNIFEDFMKALTGRGLPGNAQYELSHLRPQLLQGHRIWCAAADRRERFIEIYHPQFTCDEGRRRIWLVLELFADDLSRLDVSRKTLLSEAGLDDEFREVKCDKSINGRRVLCFEQINQISYTDRPSDELMNLVDTIRLKVWPTIMRVPPYRKYYLYLCPAAENAALLPQLLSIWCVFYYLGSVTRYRPNYFDEILAGRFGGHVEEIVSNIPQQFIFYVASEFAKREIALAPLV